MTKTVEASRRLFTCMTSSSAPARDHHVQGEGLQFQ
eukprot:UN15600